MILIKLHIFIIKHIALTVSELRVVVLCFRAWCDKNHTFKGEKTKKAALKNTAFIRFKL